MDILDVQHGYQDDRVSTLSVRYVSQGISYPSGPAWVQR